MKYLHVNDCKAKLMIERFIRGAKMHGKTVDVSTMSQKMRLPSEQIERIIKKMEDEKNVV